jgi:hypothetical protein
MKRDKFRIVLQAPGWNASFDIKGKHFDEVTTYLCNLATKIETDEPDEPETGYLYGTDEPISYRS